MRNSRNNLLLKNGWAVWECDLWKYLFLIFFFISTLYNQHWVHCLFPFCRLRFEEFPWGQTPPHHKTCYFCCFQWFCFVFKLLNHLFKKNLSMPWNWVRQQYLVIQEGSIHHPPILPQHAQVGNIKCREIQRAEKILYYVLLVCQKGGSVVPLVQIGKT